MKEGWLQCNLSEGMFPNELAVLCKSTDMGEFSFFASKKLIDAKKNLVQVSIVQCKEDSCLVYLPFDPLENIGRTVWVSRSEVREK